MPRRFGMVFTWLLLTSASALASHVIEGRVVEDHSGNPLVSVEVKVRLVGAAQLTADLESASDGTFRADELEEGEYEIEISKRNYSSTSARVRLPAPPFTVRLVRFGAISGKVADPSGKLVRARVLPFVESAGGHLRRYVGVSVAPVDARGEYRLYNLPPGKYAVAVSWSQTDFADRAGALLFPDNSKPQMFSIVSGEEYRGIDFTLPRLDPARVAGRIQNPSPAPVTSIALAPFGRSELAVARIRTNEAGEFRFDAVPPGSYHLLAGAPVVGYGGDTLVVGNEPVYARARLEASGGGQTDIVLSLEKPPNVSFILSPADKRAREDCPKSAKLTITPMEDWGTVTMGQDHRVLFDRLTTISSLAPGRHLLEVSELGARCFMKAGQILDLTEKAPAGPVPIIVEAAASVRGRLLADPAEAREFAVVLIPVNTAEARSMLSTVYPDSQASFQFTAIPPGRYRIAARRGSGAAAVSSMLEIEVLGGSETSVELPVPAKGDRIP